MQQNLGYNPLRHTLQGHDSSVFSVAYSPNGSQIASGSYDTTVRLWDAGSGALHHTLQGHEGTVFSVAYSPNGSQIASGSYDNTVRLWDAGGGALHHTLQGHQGSVNSVAYSPNGSQIASGSDDKIVRLWDVASGECRAVIEGFDGRVLSVAWKTSVGGPYLVTGSDDNFVRQWKVIEEGDEIQVRLRWMSPHTQLRVKDTLLEGVRGLSGMNGALLKQRGAVGEPLSLRKVGKQILSQSLVVSRWKLESSRGKLETSGPTSSGRELTSEPSVMLK